MRFDNSPPNADSHCYPIVRCKPRSPIRATLLQRAISGVWTHYWNGKTIACTGEDQCAACKAGIKDIWCGYIIARRHDDDRKVILAVTRVVKTDLDDFLDGPLRLHGLRVSLLRVGVQPTSPVKIQVYGREDDAECVDIKIMYHIILRLYADNANKKTLDQR